MKPNQVRERSEKLLLSIVSGMLGLFVGGFALFYSGLGSILGLLISIVIVVVVSIILPFIIPLIVRAGGK